MAWTEFPSAKPYAYRFRPEATALIIIDMQRDFLDPGGFGAIQCGDEDLFNRVREIVPRTRRVLEAARTLGLHVFHTREGHKPDLSDLPPSKLLRQISAPEGHHYLAVGGQGPMGRLLVQGEYGHEIIDELKPRPGEVVIDKPGKGSFWHSFLHRALLARGITHLLFAGVTTECCVTTTFREAADRGFECCVLSDCTAGFNQAFVKHSLEVLWSYDGLFGYAADSSGLIHLASDNDDLLPALSPIPDNPLSISVLQNQYAQGKISPSQVINDALKRIGDYTVYDPAVWIYVRPHDDLAKEVLTLELRYKSQPLPPLYGIPFGVKDNIDVANVPTTAACKAYVYTPTEDAAVVAALRRAGAIFIGKTNHDQLATGLSGCRSPFGTPRSIYGNDRIAGGSSSGSAVAVAANLAVFCLGTDTAGSGRIPAALNGVVGLKPTKGTLSARGMVPACQSLDTISIMAANVEDARKVWLVMDEGPDLDDPYAKVQQLLPLWHVDFQGPKQGGFKFGIPPPHELQLCDAAYQRLFTEATARLERAGGTSQTVDWKAFRGASDLLYGASLVQERITGIGPEFIERNLDTFHPATKAIYGAAINRNTKPWEVFQDIHLKVQYTRDAALIFQTIDVLLVPTTTCHPSVPEMEADPINLNAKLGNFTHFGNVLDLCGIALPAGMYRNREVVEDLPFGVTLLGAMGTDGKVWDIAREFERTE